LLYYGGQGPKHTQHALEKNLPGPQLAIKDISKASVEILTVAKQWFRASDIVIVQKFPALAGQFSNQFVADLRRLAFLAI
jgi:hypothetical protein